jgi:hypothetical protein
MGRLERGLEMLSYAGELAKACRDCFHDPEIIDAVAKHTTGARLESLYITSKGQGKKKRYIAHVTLEWSRCAITMTGWGVSVKAAVMNALQKRQGQYTMWQPDEDENLPF